MSTHQLRDLDRVILQHCEHGSAPLQDLLKFVARGTLYRHVGTLLRVGLLTKRGRTYETTEQGKRRLAELTASFDWNIWDRLYPPMTHIPSVAHRALAELMAAAVVARRARVQEDHHRPLSRWDRPSRGKRVWRSSSAPCWGSHPRKSSSI